MEEPVTIVDREVLKVLSVDTRMDILKLLSEGARTPSHLSDKLKKSDATIIEHLELLVKAGLVKKVEQPGKKWVFYTLTERGKGIVSSKSRRLVIILSVSILALLGGMFSFIQPYAQQSFYAAEKAAALAENRTLGEAAPALIQNQILNYAPFVLMTIGIMGIVFYMWKKSKINLGSMKKSSIVLLSILAFSLLTPFAKADGIPWPPRPYIAEEHQIALVEYKDGQITTTLDLGVRNTPENVFPLLEQSTYISSYENSFWLKTFLLTSNFKTKNLCINSYDFNYYPYGAENKWPVKLTINGKFVYLYTENAVKAGAAAEEKQIAIIPPYYRNDGQTYCVFVDNENVSDPHFVNVSSYFKSGDYNTVKIEVNVLNRGFSLNRVYLESGETPDKVKIIIPFKTRPSSIEVGGYGLDIWNLDSPFEKKKVWYGYYGGRLLSSTEAPALAEYAKGVETAVTTKISQTQVSTDVDADFKGKVADLVSEQSLSGSSNLENLKVIRFAGVSDFDEAVKSYLQDNAYVLELKVKPYETKRVTIKWVEDVADEDSFRYYYPLGTGKTWPGNISYTAVYVKLPKEFALSYSNVEGREDAYDSNYNYYRWKFVDSKPDKDLRVSVSKLSRMEAYLHEAYVWLARNSAVVGIVIILIVFGAVIQLKGMKRRRSWE
jgi:DNA-binding transcriptional ArsR family regulator